MEVGKRWMRKHPVYINNILTTFRTAGAIIVGNAFLGAFKEEPFEITASILIAGLLLILATSITYAVQQDSSEGGK